MYSYFSRCHVTTNSVAPPPLYKLHTTHNSSIRSEEGLSLETSAFRISVQWSIYIINSVDKTKLLYTTPPPTQHHGFFRNYCLYSTIFRVGGPDGKMFGSAECLKLYGVLLFLSRDEFFDAFIRQKF